MGVDRLLAIRVSASVGPPLDGRLASTGLGWLDDGGQAATEALHWRGAIGSWIHCMTQVVRAHVLEMLAVD
jgi:hypothetical protein